MPIEDVIGSDEFNRSLSEEVAGKIEKLAHVAYDDIEGEQEVQAGEFIVDNPYTIKLSDSDEDIYSGTFSGNGTCTGNWINSGSDNQDVPFENAGPVGGTWSARFPGGVDGAVQDVLLRMTDFEVEVEDAPNREQAPEPPLPEGFDE